MCDINEVFFIYPNDVLIPHLYMLIFVFYVMPLSGLAIKKNNQKNPQHLKVILDKKSIYILNIYKKCRKLP